MEVTGHFDKFTDAQYATDVGALLAGFLASEAAGTAVEGREFAGFAVPQEVGPVAVVAGASAAPVVQGRTMRYAQAGAGAVLGLNLLERAGMRDAVNEVVN